MTFSKVLVFALGCLLHSEGSFIKGASNQEQLKPTADGSRLRGVAPANATALHATGKAMPCQCDLIQTHWLPSRRVTPKCVFIDLGAANGNTLQDFVNGKYGPLANCPSGQWEATLVEANPRFDAPLKQAEVTHAGSVHARSSTAAYMCEAKTTFYLDTKTVAHNYWGSSMSANHADTEGGKTPVTVPTVNIVKLLYETTIPGDYVILKMDIEGAEWDILPCLSKTPVAQLVDRLMLEMHPQEWGNAGTTQQGLDAALATLRSKGIDIPNGYHSQTL